MFTFMFTNDFDIVKANISKIKTQKMILKHFCHIFVVIPSLNPQCHTQQKRLGGGGSISEYHLNYIVQ